MATNFRRRFIDAADEISMIRADVDHKGNCLPQPEL
jgi:hypothetical protein